jgi:hypothetical protein
VSEKRISLEGEKALTIMILIPVINIFMLVFFVSEIPDHGSIFFNWCKEHLELDWGE